MQLVLNIQLEEPLVLPMNYNHIVQSIIYRALSVMPDYAEFLHQSGYTSGKRQYKMFQFGQLQGHYKMADRKFIFDTEVSLEIRSPEPLLINLLVDSFYRNGIAFGKTTYRDIYMEIYDYTIEENHIVVQMKSPLTVYSTDEFTNNTYYYNPQEEAFFDAVNSNFTGNIRHTLE